MSKVKKTTVKFIVSEIEVKNNLIAFGKFNSKSDTKAIARALNLFFKVNIYIVDWTEDLKKFNIKTTKPFHVYIEDKDNRIEKLRSKLISC